jgi:hypothetical protein
MSNSSDALPALHHQLRRWHERARSVAILGWVAVLVRVGLALAFVPQSLLKVRGVPFTTVSTTTQIGFFFDALQRSGMYWQFIGASQLVASALLLLPATATLGALLFVPIIINIFVITASMAFPLAFPALTAGMLVLVTLLLAWDYHRLAGMIWGARAAYEVSAPPRPVGGRTLRIQHAMRAAHGAARSRAALHRLAVISRILLALAFVPTALVKVMGNRFTSISTSTPIGYFFEGLYQSGVYWRFIGASQLLAGVLLLIPATATLGAVLFFPIALSIFVITVSLHFTGTPVITGMMLLASIFLLCWDYHRFAAVVWGSSAAFEAAPAPVFPMLERVGYVVGAMGALAVLFLSRGLATPGAMRVLAIIGIACAATGAALVVAGWVQARRRTQPAPA